MKDVDWGQIALHTILITAILVVFAIIGTSIYCLIVYGNKPTSEIPGWALWFMFGAGRRVTK